MYGGTSGQEETLSLHSQNDLVFAVLSHRKNVPFVLGEICEAVAALVYMRSLRGRQFIARMPIWRQAEFLLDERDGEV